MKNLNEADRKLIDSLCPNELLSFEQWFSELNAINASGCIIAGGAALESTTGLLCWFDYFVEGLTPIEAIKAGV